MAPPANTKAVARVFCHQVNLVQLRMLRAIGFLIRDNNCLVDVPWI